MSRRFICLLLASFVACARAAPGPQSDRLRAVNGDLHIIAPRHPYWRGAYLYVLSHDPLTPDSTTRVPIGLIEVVEPKGMQVAWVCPPKQPQDAYLAADGLPVEPYDSDTELRVGKCWGHYQGPSASSFEDAQKAGIVKLRISLGPGDKVDPSVDRFELLGKPILNVNQQRIEGFERIGLCRVLAVSQGPLANECELNLRAHPTFTLDHWVRGGAIRLLPAE